MAAPELGVRRSIRPSSSSTLQWGVIEEQSMFNTILEAIKRLENRESLSKADEELLEYLNAEALKEINHSLLNLMGYGNRLGWDKIEGRLLELLSFVQQAKESSQTNQ